MAIIQMHPQNEDSYPEGAYCPAGKASYAKEKICLSKYAEGCVVSEREANFYHDSDFYATYWDAESGTFKEVLFATTRGWTYPCLGTSVDATPEVMERYQQYQKAKARRARIMARWVRRKDNMKHAESIGAANRFAVEQLRVAAGRDFNRLLKLMQSYHGGRLRSEFRISLASQCLNWVNNVDGRRDKYSTPLSRKQMLYI